ncbi:spermatogenesis-associated protein 48-like [Dendronephthya gigantea]|uniref:spermatogenesis-associated protein 48-like n=1 Tax=Dendronephthya gigantea TaxID=151771 RepID=UPI00106AA7E5|nr:spermatogenesis-associated protein 48-like [Dendronephthya gigantea]
MPVTFYDQPNLAQGKVYVDPVFRYDSSARLLGREQYQDSPDKIRLATKTDSRVSTPVSEYNRAFARCGTPQDVVDNNAMSTNACEGDQAFHEMTTGSLQDNNVSFRTEDTSRLTSQQWEVENPTHVREDIRLRDYLANKAFYTTSTQKLYQGVDWHKRINRSPAPPKTSKELNADTVSHRYELKRYEPRNEKWQVIGSRPFSWDYNQTRDGHHAPGPVSFCSPHRKIAHLPGYMGYVSGGPGEMDDPKSSFYSSNKQRTLKPRYTYTARKGNIPGYAGCVLFYDHTPACVNDPEHLRSTTANTYRPHEEGQCNSKSPYKKSAPMSRMVTLTRPFNPFNQVY